MARRGTSMTDERMDLILAILLRVGVAVSAAIVLVGGAIYLAHRGSEPPDFHVFRGEPAELRHPWAIIQAALARDDRAVIAVGLLVLFATPIARVVFSITAFARQRDYVYVGLTVIVLSVLTYSLLGG